MKYCSHCCYCSHYLYSCPISHLPVVCKNSGPDFFGSAQTNFAPASCFLKQVLLATIVATSVAVVSAKPRLNQGDFCLKKPGFRLFWRIYFACANFPNWSNFLEFHSVMVITLIISLTNSLNSVNFLAHFAFQLNTCWYPFLPPLLLLLTGKGLIQFGIGIRLAEAFIIIIAADIE